MTSRNSTPSRALSPAILWLALLCSTTLLSCKNAPMNAPNNNTPLAELAAQDWTGGTVSAVLDATGRTYDEHLFVDNKPGSLTAIGFHYPDEGWLYIYVTEYKHMKRFNIDRTWDVEAFKRETPSRVSFEAGRGKIGQDFIE